ncbi:hypothetical protein ACFVS2_26745 [Brevibacillus sp. NPDC058079]|uniref:hypothetical protein n=1 Tax=Brevibacillus sp. NPDC058079 TaxID=3346330 RepID=UPI0036E59F70
MSQITKYALLGMNYFLLKMIDLGVTIDSSHNNSFEQLTIEVVYSWLETVDTELESEHEIKDILKKDLIHELQEGSYLKNGKENFMEKIQVFFEGFDLSAYKELLTDAISEIKK